nr:RING-H2 finger protein ATL43 [Ipomoea batatas]
MPPRAAVAQPRNRQAVGSTAANNNVNVETQVIPEVRLNIKSFEEGSIKGEERDKECAICIAGFEKGDISTILSSCNHKFHSDCIAIWLSVCLSRLRGSDEDHSAAKRKSDEEVARRCCYRGLHAPSIAIQLPVLPADGCCCMLRSEREPACTTARHPAAGSTCWWSLLHVGKQEEVKTGDLRYLFFLAIIQEHDEKSSSLLSSLFLFDPKRPQTVSSIPKSSFPRAIEHLQENESANPDGFEGMLQNSLFA